MMKSRSGGLGKAPKPCERYSCAASQSTCHHGRPPCCADLVPIQTPNVSSVGSAFGGAVAQLGPAGENERSPRKSRFTSHVSTWLCPLSWSANRFGSAAALNASVARRAEYWWLP